MKLMNIKKTIIKIVGSVFLIALAVVGGVTAYHMTRRGVQDDTKLQVTASFYPYYDFANVVGGDKVSVTNMTPAGSEPHDYEPTPKELIDAHASTLFIYNGGQMEPWVDSFLADYKHTVVKASSVVDMLDEDESSDHDHAHHHDEGDPHFWLDPVIAQKVVVAIRDGLIKVDPTNESYYTKNAHILTDKLEKLNRDYEEGLAQCTLKTVISSHGAFTYLAERYHFDVSSIAGIEPDSEPSPAKMTELTDLVRQKGIRYIFFESLVSPRLAETIAHETGAETLVLDPIEGLAKTDQDNGKNYISIQYDNLRNLKKALECK